MTIYVILTDISAVDHFSIVWSFRSYFLVIRATVDKPVDGILESVETVRWRPDAALVDADLPPVEDAEHLVKPTVADEVDGVVSGMEK